MLFLSDKCLKFGQKLQFSYLKPNSVAISTWISTFLKYQSVLVKQEK